jgi:hypothetical protein
MQIVNDDVPLDLIILKLHLLTEANLYRLLAARLEIDEQFLPPLQFFPLAKLALAGQQYKETLMKVLALNDLRNEYGHELESSRLADAHAKFCAKAAVFWPPFDLAEAPAEFAAVRQAAVVTGASSCPREVWAHLSLIICDRLDAAGGDSRPLRQTVSKSNALLEYLRMQQNSLRAVYSATQATASTSHK